MKYSITFLLSCILFFSCGNRIQESGEHEDSIPEPVKQEVRIPENVSFYYEAPRADDEDYEMNPEIIVYLKLDDKNILIDTADIVGLAEALPTEIDSTYIASAGGWWAGGGYNYYAFLEKDSLIIKKEPFDEGLAEMDEGYPLEKITSIYLGE